MKKYPILITFLFVIFLYCGLAAAQLPFSLNQYKKMIEKQTEASPTSGQVEQYKTPRLYETPGTTFTASQGKYLYPIEAESLYIDTLPYFDELVIVDEETVQVIRKAVPSHLKRFGADFFNNVPTISTSQLPVSDKYVLGSGDKLIVNLWGSLNAQYELTVDREGSIYIPQVGNVAVGGLTLSSAESRVKKSLSASYSDFNTELTLGQVKSVRVFVVGQVNFPGIYDLSGLSRVMTALAAAGGPDSVGSYRNVKIFRGEKKIATFDLYHFINEGHSSGNIQLATGDVVFVPHYDILVKLRGMIKTPAKYELSSNETIENALKYAGGVLPEGNKKGIFIDRVIDGIHTSLTIDISDSNQSKTKLFDDDDISVFPINPFREKTIFLEGYTPQPGGYGWFDGIRISDLFDSDNALFDNTFMDRVDILRKIGNGKREILHSNLGKALSGDSSENLKLLSQDRVIIYSSLKFVDKEIVKIQGAVRYPGSYPLYKNMHISDLVFESGGLKTNAFLDSAEIVRITDGKDIKRFNVQLGKIISNPNSSDNIKLQKDDFIFIREIPDWKTMKSVTILGEVNFPGTYALLSDEEKLSHMLDRSGGLTKNAFLNGAVFVRPMISKQVSRQNVIRVIHNTQELTLDTLGKIDTTSLIFFWDSNELNKMIIDLSQIVSGDDDIIMEDGDTIFIPQIPDGVSIVGAAGSNGTVKYVKGRNVKYYIKRAGGLTRNADNSEIRLVKPNGKVYKVGLGYKNVGPGDVVVIPQRVKKEKDILAIFKDLTIVLSGLATTIYIILKL
ncbi:SLBB domain-containing protein [bacterium]|nr:SLBB domain-containing protein [bacterium]